MSLKSENAELKQELQRLDHVNKDLHCKLDEHKKLISDLDDKVQNRRRKMPETRDSVTHKIEVQTKDGSVDVYVIVGFYEDKVPGEIFVRCSTMGSTVSGFIDSWSIAVSLLLQHGVELKTIVDKFAHAKFEPLGYARSGEVKFLASSLIDAIVRFLGNRYLGQELR